MEDQRITPVCKNEKQGIAVAERKAITCSGEKQQRYWQRLLEANEKQAVKAVEEDKEAMLVAIGCSC